MASGRTHEQWADFVGWLFSQPWFQKIPTAAHHLSKAETINQWDLSKKKVIPAARKEACDDFDTYLREHWRNFYITVQQVEWDRKREKFEARGIPRPVLPEGFKEDAQ